MSDSLFAYRAFMRFWLARLAGTAANQMLMVAIGWQMYDLTGSAWDLGLVGLLQFAPALLLVLVAGHAVDRWHRARIFAFCMAGQALVALVLVVAGAQEGTSRGLLLGRLSGLLLRHIVQCRRHQTPTLPAELPLSALGRKHR